MISGILTQTEAKDLIEVSFTAEEFLAKLDIDNINLLTISSFVKFDNISQKVSQECLTNYTPSTIWPWLIFSLMVWEYIFVLELTSASINCLYSLNLKKYKQKGKVCKLNARPINI